MKITHFGLKRQYDILKDELLDATHLALKDGNLVGGHYTKLFEEWLRKRCGTKYAVTVNSGTQALEIIASYKKKLHGNHVPTIKIPNLTYPATLTAFIKAGWNVILEDTDKYGILRNTHDWAVTNEYNCLVGLYGMNPWEKSMVLDHHGIIIDGAQHWLVANGNIGIGMSISFDPTKNLPSSGNGGAIVTNDHHLYLYASRYKDNFKPYFEHEGTNTKMSEQECAQILVRAQHIDDWQRRRSEIANYWCNALRELPLYCLSDNKTSHAHQKFVIYTSTRNEMHTYLLTNGIESKIHYEYSLGDLPISKKLPKPDLLSTSIALSKGVLSLPIYPELKDTEIEYIRDKIIKFYTK